MFEIIVNSLKTRLINSDFIVYFRIFLSSNKSVKLMNLRKFY